MTKIIGISGSHGTGKSTTLDAIAKLQSRDPYIIVDDYKASRTVLKELKCTVQQATSNPETMQIFQNRVLDNKLYRDLITLPNWMHHAAKANFLVDRSPADLYAYASKWADDCRAIEIDCAFIPSYLTSCADAIRRYAGIILFPIGSFAFAAEEHRASQETQLEIDERIRKFLKAYRPDFYEVKSASVEDRADEIIEYVKHINQQ